MKKSKRSGTSEMKRVKIENKDGQWRTSTGWGSKSSAKLFPKWEALSMVDDMREIGLAVRIVENK